MNHELIISTERLELVLQTPDQVLAWIDAMELVDRAEVSQDWIARVRATAIGDPWGLSFSVVLRETAVVVGSCAFKGPPDEDGVVEVAYGIEPDYRRRGYAMEAVVGLSNFAFESGRVRVVRAHTNPENIASETVLQKSGFENIGIFVDPDDGLVSRWEKVQ